MLNRISRALLRRQDRSEHLLTSFWHEDRLVFPHLVVISDISASRNQSLNDDAPEKLSSRASNRVRIAIYMLVVVGVADKDEMKPKYRLSQLVARTDPVVVMRCAEEEE